MGWYLFLAGAALLILAFLLGRLGGRNSLRARDVSGNIVVGNVSGSVCQGAAPQAPAPSPETAKAPTDRVAWGIAISGVLVALAQLAYDIVK